MSKLYWLFLDMGNHDKFDTQIAKVPSGWLIKETIYQDKEKEIPISTSLISILDSDHKNESHWAAILDDIESGFYEYDSAIQEYEKNKENE